MQRQSSRHGTSLDSDDMNDVFDDLSDNEYDQSRESMAHGTFRSRPSSATMARPFEGTQQDESKLYADIKKLMDDSSWFMFGKIKSDWNVKDPIFFRDGPISAQEYKKIKRCVSCRIDFKTTKEMVFCTFCGRSACEKCTKKTRLFPESYKDPATGKPTKRDTICKLCDRKFFIRELVNDTLLTIEN